jgi:asparagine synthase (glutamine-hydrolysing)
MCGIWAWIYKNCSPTLRSKVESSVAHLTARGPEGVRIIDISGATLAFTRLAINGLTDAGMQPFVDEFTWMCNGEIYNSFQIAKEIGFVSKTGSDCEVLGALWKASGKNPVAFCRALDGVFAIVLNDGDNFIVARDPYGVRPLYWSEDRFNGLVFASERKALEQWVDHHAKIYEFPPGEVWTIPGGVWAGHGERVSKVVYHSVPWLKGCLNDTEELGLIRGSLMNAVRKRLMTERPIAALLSGGLDSSLISACVQRLLNEAGALPLRTFSIGMAGSSDLKHARLVADWIGSEHTQVVVTADEMFDVIPLVIRDIESYDITTVRASVGNWLIAREIRRRTDCKVVFNGDGSDEIWGSYLYFYKAPNGYQFETESHRLLREIHRYDVLRSDRSISSHGLEARTPFLDKQFVSAVMSIPTERRRPGNGYMEKQLMRRAFANTGFLPPEVLWRKKEAFSDGVSGVEKSWFQEIQERVLSRGLVPADWATKALEFAEPRPKTEEAFYYRTLYESMYTKTGDYWPFWMPRWSPETSDPSARTLKLVPSPGSSAANA